MISKANLNEILNGTGWEPEDVVISKDKKKVYVRLSTVYDGESRCIKNEYKNKVDEDFINIVIQKATKTLSTMNIHYNYENSFGMYDCICFSPIAVEKQKMLAKKGKGFCIVFDDRYKTEATGKSNTDWMFLVVLF